MAQQRQHEHGQRPEPLQPSPPAFIGRERELATITGALAGPPALVLVLGEAGIGKSRLATECLRAETLHKRAVMEAVCPPLPEPFPLAPVVEALQRRQPPLAALPLSPLAGALRPLLPEWADHLPPAPEPLDDPRATRHRLLRALAQLLTSLGIDLLLVEDAHWADPATLDLLLLLATGGDLSLVVTYRPTDVPADSPLPRLVASSGSGLPRTRVALEPLDHDETRALIASMFATDQVAPDFVELLHERTQGIPLALEECLTLLHDRGDIVRRGGEWTRRAVDQLRVPPTVRASVLERVSRLDPVARRVIETAAVLGQPADDHLLAAVADLPAGEVQRGLAAALASGLLSEADPGRFVVRVALASQAVEESLPVSVRRRRHRLAGQALQAAGNQLPARLSRHFREAGDLELWRRYAETAAELALASGDDRAAVTTLYDLLAGSRPDPQQRARLARKLGAAAAGGVASLGELGEQVVRALRQVLASGAADDPTGSHGPLRLLLGRMLLQLGESDEAYEQFRAAVDELADRPELAVRAMMALAFPRGTDWPAGTHLAWLERATRLLAQLPATADRTAAQADRALALLLLGEPSGWAAADEVVGDAASLPERQQAARAKLNAGHVAIGSGHYRYAQQRLRDAEQQMHATGYERLLNSVRLTQAYLDWHTGHWNALADRVREVADAVDTLPEAHLEARLILAQLELAGGDRTAARAELTDLFAEATRRGLIDALMAPAAALGRLRLADRTDAAAVTGPGVDTIVHKGMWLWASDIVPVHAQALARAGRREEAAALARQFEAGIAGRDLPAPAAGLELTRAVVAEAAGDPTQAARSYAAAVRCWAALPRPYEELLAAERQAHCMLATGDREPALAMLTATQQRLWTLGARWDADRLARQLRQQGVEVTRLWRGGRRGYGDRLSPRELQVARLVAQGMTNRQVAGSLFLSPRTVDRHLSRAMQKLGATSRTGVAVAAADAGLLDDPPAG